jgi:threonine dehydratase
VKVNQTESHGAHVVLYGDMFDDAYSRARELPLEKG